MKHGVWILPLALLAVSPALAGAPGDKQIASIDLAKAFGARSPWQFVATQGPDIDDPIMGPGDKVAGLVKLCITRDSGRTCTPDFRESLRLEPGDDYFADVHLVHEARIVRPRGPKGAPLLLLKTASLQSANGDAREGTQLLGYDRTKDRFVSAFAKVTGHNNNQEVRYVEEGPLKGDVIVAEPTDDKPFGFWITVQRLTPAGIYKQVLRFRSSTHYGDGNPLAVIDSDMPNILQRMGFWHPGKPIPAPKGCAKPHMVKGSLWC